MTDKPTEQVSPQPSLGKDSSAKRDSNAQAVEPKGGDGCTDLQAALRKACEEDAAKYLPEPRGISDADVRDSPNFPLDNIMWLGVGCQPCQQHQQQRPM